MLSKRLLALTTLAVATQASHNYNNDPSSQYTFTQNVSLDLDDDVPPPMTPPPPSAPMLCSALICDGEFLISAMMISGGDMHQPPNSNFDESDDDQDDDDDDGHSSMLSNVSLRRSVATSNGASSSFVQVATSNSQKDNVPTSGLPAFVSSQHQMLRSKLITVPRVRHRDSPYMDGASYQLLQTIFQERR